ncbi:MAG: DUF2779 domain-containing protein [Candidatus Absconditicoccaceae bacterium]
MDSEEQEEYIMNLGQQVEDAVKILLESKYSTTALDLMPDRHKDDEQEQDDDDIFSQPIKNIEQSIDRTLQAIREGKILLYQPTFRLENCLVRADFMLSNGDGTYDLIEAKAKSRIRKNVTDDGESKPIGEIEDDFKHDISFQKYVIDSVLTSSGLSPIRNTFFAYLNKEYDRDGDLDYSKLIIIDQAGGSKEIEIVQRNKPTTKEINDTLMDTTTIQQYIQKIETELSLSESEFNQLYPFPGNKYLEYFGEAKPFGTIMGMGVNGNPDIVSSLYYQGKTDIMSLTEIERAYFDTKSGTGRGRAREFIEKYIECLPTDKKIILSDQIKEILDGFNYPICFYDYESINVPIPLMDKTHPYQQVIVQYSLHKYYSDGSMKHYGAVMGGQGAHRVEQIEIPHNPNLVEFESEKVVYGHYKYLLVEFLKDIGEDINKSTFIVRHKPFENTRNKEIGEIFPDLLDDFLCINERTYDLKEIFSTGLYFDLHFKGSSSIKKVLPVLTPISYDNLDVGNGSIAMKELVKLVDNQIDDENQKKKLIEDLLIYCGQDSLAMVEIFKKLLTL